MGLYDEVLIGDRSGQVKCYENTLDLLKVGAHVGGLAGFDSYSVAMREGGYLNIDNGILTSWTDEPNYRHRVFDKWGGAFNPEIPQETYPFH